MTVSNNERARRVPGAAATAACSATTWRCLRQRAPVCDVREGQDHQQVLVLNKRTYARHCRTRAHTDCERQRRKPTAVRSIDLLDELIIELIFTND